jgi:hypothetical protein
MVVIQQPAEPLTAFNIAGAAADFLARVDDLVLQAPVIVLAFGKIAGSARCRERSNSRRFRVR